MPRVTTDQLEKAAEWLRAYEPAPMEDQGDACARVAEWIEAELARRAQEAAVRRIVRRTGASPARARLALLAARMEG